MRELDWVQRQRTDVSIFPLLPPKDPIVHDRADVLWPRVSYVHPLSPVLIWAQLYFLLRSPLRYVRALGRVIGMSWREPKVLLASLLLFPKSVWIAKQLHDRNISHVHTHFVWLGAIAASVAKELLSCSYTVHVHAFGLFSRNAHNVAKQLEDASGIVTISSYHRRYIASMSERLTTRKIDIVANGLETEEFVPRLETLQVDRVPSILAVGRLVEKKGFGDLIDACGRLRTKGLDFRCTIVGAGPLQSVLTRQIQREGLTDAVRLVGALPQDRVRRLYLDHDVFALPCCVAKDGDRDGVPVVLFEAMACGLPVVTTPIAGIPDLVKHEQNGLLVPANSPVELAAALQCLFDDPELRKRLGRDARKSACSTCDIRVTSAQMKTIFARYVDPTASGRVGCNDVMETPC